MVDILMLIKNFLDGYQIGEQFNNVLGGLFEIDHAEELQEGFKYYDSAIQSDNIADSIMNLGIALTYFKKVQPGDKRISIAYSLLGQALCLPLLKKYEEAKQCVSELQQIKLVKRKICGTLGYDKIEEMQENSSNLLSKYIEPLESNHSSLVEQIESNQSELERLKTENKDLVEQIESNQSELERLKTENKDLVESQSKSICKWKVSTIVLSIIVVIMVIIFAI